MIKRKNLTSAQIVAHSKHAGSGKEIATFIVTLPRIVLAEFNTHRAFSRNSGSSRAIPFKRMKESVRKNLFIPLAFQKHHKGMQGTEYHETGSFSDRLLVFLWWFASKMAIMSASLLYAFGCTKQLANRILEPFMWHTIVFTATEFEGFFRQRCPQYNLLTFPEKAYKRVWDPTCDPGGGLVNLTYRLSKNHSGAEIHISLAAEAIYKALSESTPKVLEVGDWHIPFEEKIEMSTEFVKSNQEISTGLNQTITDLKVKISTALCAMVSFTEVGGKSLFDKINPEANLQLHDRLIRDEHMSPTEHCAQVVKKIKLGEHSNLKGSWLQYRKIVEKEVNR